MTKIIIILALLLNSSILVAQTNYKKIYDFVLNTSEFHQFTQKKNRKIKISKQIINFGIGIGSFRGIRDLNNKQLQFLNNSTSTVIEKKRTVFNSPFVIFAPYTLFFSEIAILETGNNMIFVEVYNLKTKEYPKTHFGSSIIFLLEFHNNTIFNYQSTLVYHN